VKCQPRWQKKKYTPGFSEICLKIAPPLILSYTKTLTKLNFIKKIFTILFFHYLTPKIETLSTLESCVPTYPTVRRNISEHLNFINTAGKTSNLARTCHMNETVEMSLTV